MPRARRFVALGGGTGLPTVLRSLRRLLGDSELPGSITAIVGVSDDGGSSGRLRADLQMLPPGDVRNCVAALADERAPLTRLLQHRLTGGPGLDGHAIGNLLLAALTQQNDGDFASAVAELSTMVGVTGRVLPATAQHVNLHAEYDGGEVAIGETAITAQHRPIRRLSLQTPVRPLPEVIEALLSADVVIVGPGSLYTSILPVLLVDGVAPTLYGLRATRVYVANLMTEPGETDGFTLENHLDVIERHVGRPIFDYVLANQAPMPSHLVARYARNCAHPVRRESSRECHGSARILARHLSWEIAEAKIRHDPASLADAIAGLLEVPERDTMHTR